MAREEEPGFTIEGVTCVHVTRGALLARTPDGQEFWVPKSVIHDDSEIYKPGSESGSLIVKLWWAESRGVV